MLWPKFWGSTGPNFQALQPWIEGLAVQLGTPNEETLRFIGIAACSPGEGATTIACAVANRIQTGLAKRVLLIDANLRSPRLHQLFGLPVTPGLIDLLNGRCTLREAVQTVDDSGLCVITAGTSVSGSLAIFESEAFHAMKSRLREYFDTVIFDCSPLDGEADTFVVAKRLDGLVIVLAAEKTRWANGSRLVDRLRSANINVLGAALNGRRFFIPQQIYQRL